MNSPTASFAPELQPVQEVSESSSSNSTILPISPKNTNRSGIQKQVTAAKNSQRPSKNNTMTMRATTTPTGSSSQRSHPGNHQYDIRLNGPAVKPQPYKNTDPTAKYTNKLDNLHHIYHQTSPQIPPHIKVVVMGGYGVGKTSLMDQFTEKHQPSEIYRPTKYPNENQYRCTYTLDARRVYNLEVLDTEGLEPDSEFPTRLLPQDMKQFAYLVVFSVSHYGSFKLAEELLKQLVISLEFDTETPIVLVGNKSDIPTKRDEGYTFYTTDKNAREYKMWDPEQERAHRKDVGSFYDPEIHDEYRQVKQEDAWKLASKFNIKYKEVTAQCYADIVNVFVEVVTQRDKICDHRRRMDIDADNREAGELTCDFMSTSPQKRRKYFETMKLEYEFRVKELQTRLNLGVLEKSEFNAYKDDLDFWMNDLKISFDRMNSMGYSMHPHMRELHQIEGRYVREPAPDRSHILNEVYPPSCPDTNLWAGRKSKDPSTSSETKVETSKNQTTIKSNLTSASLISKNAPASKKTIIQKSLLSKNNTAKVSFENKTSTAASSSSPKTTSPNSSPSKINNNSSSSTSKTVKKSKKSKNSSSSNNSSRSSPNKNTTASASSSSRNRNSTSTSSRPSPNGTRRRRSDSQGSFRTLSGVLDMFKNLPERIIGKVS